MMEPFEPRPTSFHGLRSAGGWQLKLYSIRHGAGPVDWDFFAPGIALAEAALPQPAAAEGRPGVGFLIVHQGRTGNYVVLGWWDRENELPLRIFVHPGVPGGIWRRNEGSESICVWDLEIIWAERGFYVETMLVSTGESVPEYLSRHAGTTTEFSPGDTRGR